MEKRFRATAIIFQQGKLLVIERVRAQEHYFALPGGGVEAGESAIQALNRELEEELGLQILNADLLETVESDTQIHAIIKAQVPDGEPVWREDHKQTKENSYQPKWVTTEELLRLPLMPIEARRPLTEFLSRSS